MSANGKGHEPHPEVLTEPLLEAMRVAYAPDSIEPDLNDRLIEEALTHRASSPLHVAADATMRDDTADDTEDGSSATPASASRNEIAQAELLRKALEGAGSHPLSDLAELLHAAYAPASPDTTTSETFAQRALRLRPESKVVRLRNWSYATMAMAIAAGAALWFLRPTNPQLSPTTTFPEQLVQSRSAAPLFAETFEQRTPTERIDHLYAVRSRELRHNRYATWRVR